MDRLNFFTKKFMKKINKDNFKKTLSAFATGITVVATKYNSVLRTGCEESTGVW